MTPQWKERRTYNGESVFLTPFFLEYTLWENVFLFLVPLVYD